MPGEVLAAPPKRNKKKALAALLRCSRSNIIHISDRKMACGTGVAPAYVLPLSPVARPPSGCSTGSRQCAEQADRAGGQLWVEYQPSVFITAVTPNVFAFVTVGTVRGRAYNNYHAAVGGASF